MLASIQLAVTGTVSGLANNTAANSAYNALATNFSGSTAPTAGNTGLSSIAGLTWRDTSVTPNVIRLRDDADTVWIPILVVDQTGKTVAPYASGINAQTGTTYTMLATDLGRLVSFANAGAIAVTLPQATTAGFTKGAAFPVQCLASSVGTVTITPTTSTINGAATLVLLPGQSAIIYSDGTNYTALFTNAGALNKAQTWSAAQTFSSAVALSGVISPAQLTANTDDWAPTGLADASTIRVDTDASRNLTGLTGGAAGRAILLENVGANPLVLVHNSTSTAANQFLCPGASNFTLGAGGSVWLAYDSTSSRWRVLAPAVVGSSIAVAIYQNQQSSNTAGPTFSAGSFQTFPLTTEVVDPNNIGSLSGNQITLIAGTYLMRAVAHPGRNGVVLLSRLRLYNATDAAVIIQGVNAYAGNINAAAGAGYVEGYFTIAGSKAIELQVEVDAATTFGCAPVNTGENEVYANITVMKLA